MKHPAFTLIELLVVVAIIAILAAIALPNFLAAQERAKVSRAQADIRTIVTGLETYRIDWNAFPTYHYIDGGLTGGAFPEFRIGGTVTAVGLVDSSFDGRNPLTTPISYLTAMPDDPFALSARGLTPEVGEYAYVNWPYALQVAAGTVWEPIFTDVLRFYGPYRIHSRGPDGDGPDSGVPYDPTNGSRSDGDVTFGPYAGFNDAKFFIWRNP